MPITVAIFMELTMSQKVIQFNKERFLFKVDQIRKRNKYPFDDGAETEPTKVVSNIIQRNYNFKNIKWQISKLFIPCNSIWDIREHAFAYKELQYCSAGRMVL